MSLPSYSPAVRKEVRLHRIRLTEPKIAHRLELVETLVYRRRQPLVLFRFHPGDDPLVAFDVDDSAWPVIGPGACWLLICHGVDPDRVYRAEAALLDLEGHWKVIARTPEPILEPEEKYERGRRPQRHLSRKGGRHRRRTRDLLRCSRQGLLRRQCAPRGIHQPSNDTKEMPSMKLRRYAGNPILKPRSEHPWEALNVFNAGVGHHNGRFHML